MPNIKELLVSFSNSCTRIAQDSLIDEVLSTIASNHAALDDFSRWATIVSDRPESIMLSGAIREYQFSMIANLQGLYNLSFTGLRFFFERSLTSIFLSSKEIDLRLWMKGNRDTYWSEICNDDNGLFSHSFANAFFPELKDEVKHYLAIAKKVYRECSEYVHGNISTHVKVPSELSYSGPLVEEWHSKADTIKEVILFAFCLRYLPYLSQAQKSSIEQSVLDNLSHINPIRNLIQQPN